MLRDDDVVLVISNAPDLLLAKRIAHVLVEDGLAACVNLGAPGLSIYPVSYTHLTLPTKA